MTDNRPIYGFRWNRARNGGRAMPVPEECIVATSQTFDVTGGAQNVSLRPGDPVIKLSTGGINLCVGAEDTPAAIYGIVVGIEPSWDAVQGVMQYGNYLPDAVAWGTNLNRQSKVKVVPFEAGFWEIDADAAVSAATKATFQDYIGGNAEMILSGAAGESYAYPRLDISSIATTATLFLRIINVAETLENKYFDGNYVKMIVGPNPTLTQDATALAV